MIAFVCAMPMELKPLSRKLALAKTTIGGVEVRTGTLGGRDVVAVVTGMGLSLATEGTTRLLDAVEPTHVVSVGITGALDNATEIGALVLPEAVIHGPTGVERSPSPLGDGTPRGKMWSSDEIITDPERLADLRARGVVSLDMETAAIAEVCEAREVPWSVFRVISDRASDGSVDEAVFHLSNQDGSPNPLAVAKYFATHPTSIPRMAKLARGATLAADRAADAALRACADL